MPGQTVNQPLKTASQASSLRLDSKSNSVRSRTVQVGCREPYWTGSPVGPPVASRAPKPAKHRTIPLENHVYSLHNARYGASPRWATAGSR